MVNNTNHPAEDSVTKKAIDDEYTSITAKIPDYVKAAMVRERDKISGKIKYGDVIKLWYDSISSMQKAIKERDNLIEKLSKQNTELLFKLKEVDESWEKKKLNRIQSIYQTWLRFASKK